jgi:hypothetical protein
VVLTEGMSQVRNALSDDAASQQRDQYLIQTLGVEVQVSCWFGIHHQVSAHNFHLALPCTFQRPSCHA